MEREEGRKGREGRGVTESPRAEQGCVGTPPRSRAKGMTRCVGGRGEVKARKSANEVGAGGVGAQ